jgi:DNA polymerase I-like protein with 3'-5' exonuclease and polymerase domains
LIADIGNGLDLHRQFAAVVLNKPLADVTDKERQTAKAMVFSLLYRSGVTGLRDSLLEKGIVLSREQVQQLRGQFFRRYAGFADWYGSLRQVAVTEMRTLSGRRRLWPEPAPFPEACNTPIQGTGADILKKALSILPDALHEVGGKVLACVHDDILLEVANDKAEQAERILVGAMNAAWGHYIKRVPIAVESKILDCWE